MNKNLNIKYHWSVSDYLQRSARHISSKTDVEQAIAVGEVAANIPIGTRVEVHGLNAKKQKRQRGEVVGFDASSGRCEVKLDDGRGPYRLKPENLKERD